MTTKLDAAAADGLGRDPAEVARRVEAAVARILAAARRDVAAHRAKRTRWIEQHGAAGRGEGAAGTLAGLIRDRRRQKTF